MVACCDGWHSSISSQMPYRLSLLPSSPSSPSSDCGAAPSAGYDGSGWHRSSPISTFRFSSSGCASFRRLQAGGRAGGGEGAGREHARIWSPGPLAPLVIWSLGPLVLWPPGLLVPWSFGPLVPWSLGPLVLWSPGPLAPWSFGTLVHSWCPDLNAPIPWCPGFLVPLSLNPLVLCSSSLYAPLNPRSFAALFLQYPCLLDPWSCVPLAS